MATTKTLTPTNQTISIPELTDAPDMSVPADAIDKEADAINAIDNKVTRPNNFTTGSVSLLSLYNSLPVGYYSSANGGIGNWWVENASSITDLPSGVTLGNYVNITIKRMGSTGSVFLESSTGSVELSIVGTTITVVTDKTLNEQMEQSFVTEDVTVNETATGNGFVYIALPSKTGYTPVSVYFVSSIQSGASGEWLTFSIGNPMYRPRDNGWNIRCINTDSSSSPMKGTLKVLYRKNPS